MTVFSECAHKQPLPAPSGAVKLPNGVCGNPLCHVQAINFALAARWNSTHRREIHILVSGVVPTSYHLVRNKYLHPAQPRSAGACMLGLRAQCMLRMCTCWWMR